MPHNNTVNVLDNAGWDNRIIICQNPDMVNTFIIISQRYVVLVDTMINPVTAQAMMAAATPHLTGKRTLLVINTHADYDHCWGNQLFAGPDARYPAPIIGSRKTAELLHSNGAAQIARYREHEPDIFTGVTAVPPTLLFDKQLTIDGGDLTLELFVTPGHTVDHTSLYIPEIKTVLAADAAEWPYPMARHHSGLSTMRHSIEKLLALDSETVLYCHADPTTGKSLLEQNKAYFDAIEAHCREALANGTPVDPPPDADVIALVGCSFATAMPAAADLSGIHAYYQTQGHATQIRAMLLALGNEGY